MKRGGFSHDKIWWHLEDKVEGLDLNELRRLIEKIDQSILICLR